MIFKYVEILFGTYVLGIFKKGPHVTLGPYGPYWDLDLGPYGP